MNKRNTIMQKIYIKNYFKKNYIFSNKNKIFKTKNLIKLDIKINNKKKSKKKQIIFIDRGIEFLTFYNNQNKEKYINNINKILEEISKRNWKKYNLIFKPHPRQKKINYKLHKFKIGYANNYLEQVLEKNKNYIYCIIGITTTGIKISDLYGIKTYSVKNLLNLGESLRFNRTLINNSNIKVLSKFNQLKRI